MPNGAINFLESFHYDDQFIEFIHYYSSGIYRNYDIELIINGDFFDFLQVDYRGYHLTVRTENISLEILKSMIAGHPKIFASLRKFAVQEGNSITYIMGNHDQDMLWPATREYLNEVIGIDIRYINIVYFFDGIHIEHGHMKELINRFNPKKFFIRKNVAEPVLNLPFGSHFCIDFILKLKRKMHFVDKVRPFLVFIRWMFVFHPIRLIKGSFSFFWHLFLLNFPSRQKISWSFIQAIRLLVESFSFSSLEDVAKDILFSQKEVNTVILGHTHVYHYRQWNEDKEYFNTGTWTDVTSLNFSHFGKITKLTYVSIEYPDGLSVDKSGDKSVNKGGDKNKNETKEENVRPRCFLKEWRGYHKIESDITFV